MTWLAPLAAGLALVSLPIIAALHLLRQRRRRLRVPAVELWHDPAPTLQQRPRQLPITLPLLLRLLVALLLALALGQPLLRNLTRQPVSTVVLLDTSLSMLATDVAPSRFAAAQTEVRRLIGALRPGDELALITLGATPRLVVRGGPEASRALQVALNELQPLGGDGSVQAALDLAAALFEPPRRPRIVVLTDAAQHAEADLLAPAPVEWQALGAAADNVAFAAFATRPSGRGLQLYARVTNLGQRPVARTLTLLLDDQPALEEVVRLEPGADIEWSWPLPPDKQLATARLSGSDALAQDDQQQLLLRGNSALRVLLVSASPSPLERALRALPNVLVTTATPASYTTAATDVAVFVGVVPKSLPAVPTWLVAPPTSELLSFTEVRGDLAITRVPDSRFGALDLRALRFDGVGLITLPPWATAAILSATSADSVPLVLTGVQNGQLMAVWNFDPSRNNLANRLQFPLLAAATLRSLSPALSRGYFPGDLAPQLLLAPTGATVDAGAPLPIVGVYRATDNALALTVNVLDPLEANLQAQPTPSVQVVAAQPVASTQPTGLALWRWAVGLVIAGLLLEALYAKRTALQARLRWIRS